MVPSRDPYSLVKGTTQKDSEELFTCSNQCGSDSSLSVAVVLRECTEQDAGQGSKDSFLSASNHCGTQSGSNSSGSSLADDSRTSNGSEGQVGSSSDEGDDNGSDGVQLEGSSSAPDPGQAIECIEEAMEEGDMQQTTCADGSNPIAERER